MFVVGDTVCELFGKLIKKLRAGNFQLRNREVG